jgi:hypothetical protein
MGETEFSGDEIEFMAFGFAARREKKVGGRKPAQPSIPEGILGFPPPDAHVCRTRRAIPKLLKTQRVGLGQARKKCSRPVKFADAS